MTELELRVGSINRAIESLEKVLEQATNEMEKFDIQCRIWQLHEELKKL